MRTDVIAPLAPPVVSPDGVLFLYSPNLALRIRYGRLVIDLGRGGTLTVDRASDPRLRRLVLCGRGGWWTFEVAEWVRGVGASWVHLDLPGRILGSGPGDVSPDLPALRRMQALAPGAGAGIEIGRWLLSLKIAGQAAALGTVESKVAAAQTVKSHIDHLEGRSATELRAAEAQAAVAFWDAIADVPVRFVAGDEANVPESWRTVGRRASAITGSPRGASTPAHAFWNFAYSCAASEVGVALRGTGLDPGISPTGLHADTPSRASATWDVLEAIRGEVDRLILTTIVGRRFRRRDFAGQPDGRVRLTAPLAREVAEAVIPLARRCVAPIAEELARRLARAAEGRRTSLSALPTNLTGANRSRGRDATRRSSRPRTTKSERIAQALLPAACIQCGVIFEGRVSRRRRYCDDCLLPIKAARVETLTKAGPAALAEMRMVGRDPTQAPESRAKLSESMSRRGLDVAAWDREHDRPDPELFRRDILPGLQGVPLARIVVHTGLSLRYASLIRRGERTPHPMHWEALKGLVDSGPPTSPRVVERR